MRLCPVQSVATAGILSEFQSRSETEEASMVPSLPKKQIRLQNGSRSCALDILDLSWTDKETNRQCTRRLSCVARHVSISTPYVINSIVPNYVDQA